MKTPIQYIDIIIVTFAMSLSLFLLSITVWGETIPEMYDLRTVNGNCFITSIKNQGDYGDCWSFSAVAAMESNLLKQGFGSQDLSELEIGYYVIIPGSSEPPVRTLRATIPENESH